MQKNTSWGNVAEWYDDAVTDTESYQQKVILPNLLRLLGRPPTGGKGMTILDLGCGQGFFAREFAKQGANVIGTDIAQELIAIAKKNVPNAAFHVASADAMPFVSPKSVHAITIILSLQNIENAAGVFAECARVLRPKGRLLIVLNHPAFRIPKHSSWGWDTSTSAGGMIQYRRVDTYLSESRTAIAMHPGSEKSPTTTSFHRPLQFYFKAFAKYGFAVTHCEEWISYKTSQKGPRAKAEDTARKEIPLFLFLEVKKL